MHRAWISAHPTRHPPAPKPAQCHHGQSQGTRVLLHPMGFLPLNLFVPHQWTQPSFGMDVPGWWGSPQHVFPQHGLVPMAIVTTGAVALGTGSSQGAGDLVM